MKIDKTVYATTQVIFLGFLLDTMAQTISPPREKVITGLNMITYILGKKNKKATLYQIQKICGFLNFLSRAIIPERAFTQRLYALTATSGSQLKPYHHIKLNLEVIRDLQTWNVFLQHPNVFCRKFVDCSQILTATQIDFASDASKTLGS